MLMRLLLIEDEQRIVGNLKPALEAEYFSVEVAEDGEKGYLLAQTNEYDIIVLDNILPKKTGLQVCKELHAKANTTPIIMLSVGTEADTKVELLNAGANDYVSKPFSFNELLARIRVQLRTNEKAEPSQILVIEDLILDTKERTARRGTKEIHLNNKESKLLEYLMRNVGNVLSRSMIMEHVWGMAQDPFSRTIDSHILNLRKKIEVHGKKILIHTKPGAGYWMGMRSIDL